MESPCNSTCPKGCHTIEYINDVSDASFPNEKYQDFYADKYGCKKSYIRYLSLRFLVTQQASNNTKLNSNLTGYAISRGVVVSLYSIVSCYSDNILIRVEKNSLKTVQSKRTSCHA